MKIIILLTTILISFQAVFSQQAKDILLSLTDIAWPLFAEPYINKKVNDELTKEIFKRAVPKLIHQDYEGAVSEICNSIYKIKNVKVLNTEFITMLRDETKNVKSFIDKKDFLNAAMKLTELGININSYLKSDILIQEDSEVKTLEISNTTKEQITQDISDNLDNKMYMSRFDDYAFYISNGTSKERDYGNRTDEEKEKDNPDNFTDQYTNVVSDGKEYGMMVAKFINKELFVPEKDLFKYKDEFGMKLKEIYAQAKITITSYEFKNYKHVNNVYKCKIYHQPFESKGYLYLIVRGSAFYQVYFLVDNKEKDIAISSISEEIMNSFVVVSDNSLNDKISKTNQRQRIIDNVKVSGSYNEQIFGTNNLAITVTNNSGFQLDQVIVSVKFYGKMSGKVYCDKQTVFENVTDKKTLRGPSCENGKEIKVKIKKIISKELDLNIDL